MLNLIIHLLSQRKNIPSTEFNNKLFSFCENNFRVTLLVRLG